jgi:hypothetical protein
VLRQFGRFLNSLHVWSCLLPSVLPWFWTLALFVLAWRHEWPPIPLLSTFVGISLIWFGIIGRKAWKTRYHQADIIREIDLRLGLHHGLHCAIQAMGPWPVHLTLKDSIKVSPSTGLYSSKGQPSVGSFAYWPFGSPSIRPKGALPLPSTRGSSKSCKTGSANSRKINSLKKRISKSVPKN